MQLQVVLDREHEIAREALAAGNKVRLLLISRVRTDVCPVKSFDRS